MAVIVAALSDLMLEWVQSLLDVMTNIPSQVKSL